MSATETSNKWLSVPLNAKGIEDLENEIDNPEDIHDYELSKDELNAIVQNDVLDKMNERCGTSLKEGAKEVIPASGINHALDVLEENDLADGMFAAALFELRYTGTFIFCDFA